MEKNQTLGILETKLLDIETKVYEAITFSLETIKSDPSLEKEILQLLIPPSKKISDYFFRETERTGTENVGKRVIKYAMFKKF